jgi:phosphoribosyl-dephospho-CoA transferase
VVEPIRRHSFVELDAAAVARSGSGAADSETRDVVLAWLAAGRPAVRARDARNPSVGSISLGIAMPPDAGKRRVALTVPVQAVVSSAPPPLLASLIETSGAHRSALLELQRRGDDAGLRFRVFGSFAWQYATGLIYVTDTSDLDVLWYPRREREVLAAIAVLSRWEKDCGMRADGEAVFPDGDAVSWREWTSGSATVLVKSIRGARLSTRAACLASFDLDAREQVDAMGHVQC